MKKDAVGKTENPQEMNVRFPVKHVVLSIGAFLVTAVNLSRAPSTLFPLGAAIMTAYALINMLAYIPSRDSSRLTIAASVLAAQVCAFSMFALRHSFATENCGEDSTTTPSLVS